jgi:hypothetical protein
MFESEIEMEKRQSSFGPLIVILALVGVVVGGIGFFGYQQMRGFPQEDAKAAVLAIVAEKPVAKISFTTGNVKSTAADLVSDPHYRLLAKAGIIKLGKIDVKTPVTLTPEGEKILSAIPGYVKSIEKDGTVSHTVPLAKRQFVAIDPVEKLTHSTSRVDYTWKWEPTALGTDFDASGKFVKSFSTWERSVLIDKYGAAFYNADPEKVSLVFVKKYDGWKLNR